MKVPYTSLRDYAKKYISDNIYMGVLKPGDRISEQEIAARMNVSRTPAREALTQLQAEGFLEYTPRKGFSITRISEQEKQEHNEVIALLDAWAAVTALPSMGDKDLIAMNECIEKIDVAIKYHNLEDYRLLQHQFHTMYRGKCGNAVLLKILGSLETALVPEIFLSENTEKLFALYKIINDEHREIVRLMAEKKPEELFNFLRAVHWMPRREAL